MSRLTAKQERFCQEIVVGQTLSEAYRVAFAPNQMSSKTINEEASRLAKTPKITARIHALRAPVVARTQATLADRLTELSYAVLLDPAACFDAIGHPLSLQVMPEHVRRAIASYDVDPVSGMTRIKFIDKLSAIMNYSKLAGDIPKEKAVDQPATPRHDLSKLADEEFREFIRLRKKATITQDAPS